LPKKPFFAEKHESILNSQEEAFATRDISIFQLLRSPTFSGKNKPVNICKPNWFRGSNQKKCFSPNPFMTLLHTGNRTNWIENKRIILTFTLTYMILRSSLQRYEYCRFLRGKQKYCKLEPFILHFSIKVFQWLKDLAKTEKEYP